eukprot:1353231-Ditylum_brightwellii.AAC.1
MTNVLTENKQHLEVETFPKGVKEAKDLLVYKRTEGYYHNVTMIIHVTGLIPFSMLKSKMLNYLKINNIYLNMTIFCNTKETMAKIGHLTKINLTKIYRAACQENLNNMLSVLTSELNKEDAEYFAGNGTTWGMENYSVQLKPAKPNITIGNETVTTEALAVYSLW